MIDVAVVHMVLGALTGWLERRERQAIAYLIGRTASYGVSWVGVGSGSVSAGGLATSGRAVLDARATVA